MALSDPQVAESQDVLLAHLAEDAVGAQGDPGGGGGSTYFVVQRPREPRELRSRPAGPAPTRRTHPRRRAPAATMARHRMPVAELDALAAGRITPRTAARMASAERSRRMLMLRSIVEAGRAAEPLGPLVPVEEACELIARAQHLNPEPVERVLAHPPIGLWAVRVLGRLGREIEPDPDEQPLWHEVGYLHALAAAAALRSGLPVTLRVPTYHGTVALPTLGHAVLAEGEEGYATAGLESDGRGTVTLSRGSLRLELPPDLTHPGPGWHPVRTLDGTGAASGTAEPESGLALDGCDPYRDFRLSCPPPAPHAEEEGERWRQLMVEARELLRDRHAHLAPLVSGALTGLVPLTKMPRFRTSSASYAESCGSALVSLPHDAVDLAVTLVHESRHSALNGLSHQIGLVDREAPGKDVLLYAPWRTDPRPPWGLLHGAYAFSGVVEFWRTERHALTGPAADLAHFEYAVWRDAVVGALATLGEQDGLSVWGRRFVAAVARQADTWADDQVPDTIRDLAQSELADLRATWRARHLVPDSSATRRLAELWTEGGSAAGQSVPASRLRRADAQATPPELRREIRRLILADGGVAGPVTWARLAHLDRPARLLDADLSLLLADADGAVDAYRSIVLESPEETPAWVGLGLSLALAGEEVAARALLERPELVRAVGRQVRAQGARPADPVELARWVGRLPDPPDGR
ncbi:HEXXH motif domain-containing protein [Streptomyces sp. T-3]|nr:HEXXH motif domain-containing protein [Streptomyces sp. T-3]